MFVFWIPCACAKLHQQKRALKLCSATLSVCHLHKVRYLRLWNTLRPQGPTIFPSKNAAQSPKFFFNLKDKTVWKLRVFVPGHQLYDQEIHFSDFKTVFVNLVPRSLVDEAKGKIWPNPICITWSPVRNVTGEASAHAQHKFGAV